jgi:hypothetical protein
MEVFRSDGAGKSYANERLNDLVKLCETYSIYDLDEIEKINDHKGTLTVSLKKNTNAFYWFYFFSTFWNYMHEYWIIIVCNDEVLFDSY